MPDLRHLLHLDAPSGERLATIAFPRPWLQGREWVATTPVVDVALSGARRAHVAAGCLDDGTNLVGMAYPGGQRVLRAPVDGGVHEHFDGRPLNGSDPDDELLVTAWRRTVDAWVRTGRSLATAAGEERT